MNWLIKRKLIDQMNERNRAKRLPHWFDFWDRQVNVNGWRRGKGAELCQVIRPFASTSISSPHSFFQSKYRSFQVGGLAIIRDGSSKQTLSTRKRYQHLIAHRNFPRKYEPCYQINHLWSFTLGKYWFWNPKSHFLKRFWQNALGP